MGHLYHGYVSHNQMVRFGHISQWPIDVSHSASSSATAPFVQCGWRVLQTKGGFTVVSMVIWMGYIQIPRWWDSHGYAACLPKWIPTCRMTCSSKKNVRFCFSMCGWCPGGPGRIPSTIRINSKLDLTTVGMFEYIYMYWYHDRQTDSKNHDISNHDIIQR